MNLRFQTWAHSEEHSPLSVGIWSLFLAYPVLSSLLRLRPLLALSLLWGLCAHNPVLLIRPFCPLDHWTSESVIPG